MKLVYPVVFHETGDKVPYYVEIPDFNAMTQGTTLENAIEMARDVICIKIAELQDRKGDIPRPSDIRRVKVKVTNSFVSLVDVDI